MKNNDTSWNTVSDWYDALLEEGSESYQSKVILPNLLRLMDITKGDRVFDLACGQGYFSRAFQKSGAIVIGSDLSPRLIEIATKSSKDISFHVAPAHQAPFLKDSSVDIITIVLAIQNIENVGDVFKECARVLTKKGKMYVVLNHPAFRIPKGSDWSFKDGVQSRLVSQYLSESKVAIDMTPGEKDPKKKVKTVSFHRPLQWYMKMLSKNGFVITRLEEWISHKKSGKGPRQGAEDIARKEIPLFMCLEIGKR